MVGFGVSGLSSDPGLSDVVSVLDVSGDDQYQCSVPAERGELHMIQYVLYVDLSVRGNVYVAEE